MISAFQIFKIIFGIIFSVFVLILIFRFSGSYLEIGETGTRADVLMNLKKGVEDVYTGGISQDYRIRNSDDLILLYEPPELFTTVTTLDFRPVPALILPEENVGIHRIEYDLGWWKFYFVEVLPDTTLLFNPTENTEEIWKYIYGMVRALPSTENLESKFYFALGCNSTPHDYPIHNWEREKMMKYERGMKSNLDTAGFRPVLCEGVNPEWKAVVISGDFTETDHPLIIPSGNGSGLFYPNTSDPAGQVFFKTPVDLVSLLFWGEDGFDYMNREFLGQLSAAAEMRIRENSLLAPRSSVECIMLYGEFNTILEDVSGLSEEDHRNIGKMAGLAERLEESERKYSEIRYEGCE